MAAYHSCESNLFVGIGTSNQEAMSNAIEFAKAYWRTDDIAFNAVDLPASGDEFQQVAIEATPKVNDDQIASDEKEATLISEEPWLFLYINEGGDIGVPFFRLSGQHVVITRESASHCYFTYFANLQPQGFVQHTHFNQRTEVFVRLFDQNRQSVGDELSVGSLSVSCRQAYSFRLKRTIPSTYYPVIRYARVRLGYTEPSLCR